MSSKTEFTIEDVSPLILYSNQWRTGDKVADPLANRYSGNATFTLSTDNGASATFKFNGSSILIAGAKRSNHGPYSVNLDGTVTSENGFGNDLFQTALFQRSDLSEAQTHTVVITNLNTDSTKPFLDIDFIKWTTTTHGDGSQLVLEDTSGQFRYQPDSAWSTDVSALQGFGANSGHLTRTSGAQATLNFAGDAIDVLGAVGPDFGQMQVVLDGGPAANYNLTKTNYQAQTTIFHASNLGAGNHTIVFSPSGNGLISLDQARIWNFNGPTSSKSGGIGTGAIAGIVVGVVLVIALAGLGFFLWRRKRGQSDRLPVPPSSSAFTIDQFGPGPQTAQTSQYQTSQYQSSSHNLGGSRPGPTSEYSFHSGGSQPLQPNQAGGSTYMPNPYSDAGSSSGRLAYDEASNYGGTFVAGDPNPQGGYTAYNHPNHSRTYSSGNTPHNAVSPSSAGYSSGHYPTATSTTSSYNHPGNYPSEKGRRRDAEPSVPTARTTDQMYLEGREQDAGPAPSSMLPPAYEQATEAFDRR